MAPLASFDPWWRFGVALLIGALMGLEREFIQQKADTPDFAGIRTFSLIALLGAVAAFVSEQMGLSLAVIAFAGVVLITVISYIGEFVTTGRAGGTTTEIAVLLAYLLGALVMWDYPEIAIALGVIVALLLALKTTLHNLARRMSTADLNVTLEFALVALVVLPILPNRTIDPLDVLNPSQVWLMVVFVSGIGFAGYLLMKFVGTEKGIGLTGLVGGIVSSTATTLSFSTRSKEAPRLSGYFAQAIVLASSVMFPRVVIEVLAVHPPLLGRIVLPLAAMLIAGLLAVGYLMRQHSRLSQDEEEGQEVDLQNPLKLSTAITFGLVFAVVLIGVKLAQQFFGNAGVYVASVLTGLTDVDAITLSVARLSHNGQITPDVAATAILIAAVMNTVAKAGIALSVGAPDLRRPILRAFGLMVLVGAVSIGLMFVIP